MSHHPQARFQSLIQWPLLVGALLLPIVIGVTVQEWLQQVFRGPLWWIVLVVCAQVVAVGTLYFMRWLQPSSLRSTLQSTRRLEATARQLPRIHDMSRLLKLTTRLLVCRLGASHATIYLGDPQTSLYHLTVSYGSRSPATIQHLDASSPLIRWFCEHRKALSPADCRRDFKGSKFNVRMDPYRRLNFILENLKAELIVPIFRGKRLVGLVVLGKRVARRAAPSEYTEVEVQVLIRLASDYAIALENARSYEQLNATAKKLQSTQDRLIRQERMVAAGRLAMGLAHEIKNPLAAIKTFTEFLPERHQDPAFRQEFSHIVGKEVDRISAIVQSLSDFARPVLLKLRTVDIQRVLYETVTLLSNDCLKRSVSIKQSFEPEPILLEVDPSQLKQAFLNLCMNALEAMRGGGTLSVSCVHEAGEAVIRITDTGVGIPTEHLPVLFDPFFTTKDGGMGLGLAVVRQIVQQHLGSIRAESQVGVGSAFEVRLPLAVRFKPSASGDGHERHTRSLRELKVLSAVPMDLLVVDDEPKVQALLKDGFEVMGCRVRVTASGEEALDLIATKPPQLLVLDLKLQEMDGFEVLKRVKMRYPLLPVIVITGTFDERIDRHVQELGALVCLHKPIDLPALQRQVVELSTQLSCQR